MSIKLEGIRLFPEATTTDRDRFAMEKALSANPVIPTTMLTNIHTHPRSPADAHTNRSRGCSSLAEVKVLAW